MARRARQTVFALVSLTAGGLAAVATGCTPGEGKKPDPGIRIVLRAPPLGTDAGPLRGLVEQFERLHPGIRVELQAIPGASDLAHQLLVTALGAGSPDLDVFALDVIWAAEFTRAGWLADLSGVAPPEEVRSEFVAGAAEAATADGRTRALPWYVDVGLLYFRQDLVPEPPRTYRDLEAEARVATAGTPGLLGFVWQGRQYEGLSCNFFEQVWGRGGDPAPGRLLVVDDAAARAALRWMRGLVASGITPASVVVMAEEDARRVFQEGRAVFMRNWPYAWRLLQEPGSPVRGKVGVAPLPSESGAPGPGVLGGWLLGVSAQAPAARRSAAALLVRHLTSAEASLLLALSYGRSPARLSTYDDPRLRQGAPFLASLLPLVEHARPRPVTPFYMMVADPLQGELSAAVSGLRTPDEALRRAQAQVDLIAGVGR